MCLPTTRLSDTCVGVASVYVLLAQADSGLRYALAIAHANEGIPARVVVDGALDLIAGGAVIENVLSVVSDDAARRPGALYIHEADEDATVPLAGNPLAVVGIVVVADPAGPEVVDVALCV